MTSNTAPLTLKFFGRPIVTAIATAIATVLKNAIAYGFQRLIVALAVSCLFFASPAAKAAFSPVGISILAPIQFPPSDFSITGARASALWGRHRDVYGIDVGLIGNITEQSFVGIGVSGIFNNTRGLTTILGLQAAGIGNFNSQKTNVYGLQLALGVNSNTAASTVVGFQVAALNLATHTDVYGAQVGIYNRANEVYGLQIGLVNVASNLHGVQIGLLNFNHKGLFAVSPILNAGF